MKRFLLVCGLALLLVPSASAAKGKVSLAIVEASPYVYGQTITVATNDQLATDGGFWISMFCSQNGVTVYGFNQRETILAASYGPFMLAGQGWTGGAASCLLRVWHVNPGLKNQTTDAELTFDVSG